MPDNLRPLARTALEKHHQRFAPPQLALTGTDDAILFDCPYREEDRENWQALLFEAFGTRSISVANTFLRHLSAMCAQEWQSDDETWRPSVEQLNTAIAVVASTEPQNESQACIAAQMVSLHFTAMKLAKVMGGHTTYPDERTAATAARVSKTYANLARTLADLQGKGGRRQDIHVHYYHDQRQQTVNMGGGQDFGGQPHAPNREIQIASENRSDERRPALPSPCQDYGATVPRPSREGKARVQDAWWFTRLWRTFRGAQW